MLTLVDAPIPFVTLAEAKKHLNVTHLRDDSLISGQLASAMAYLDGPQGYLGAAIASQKWEWKVGAFADPLRLPLGPIITVDAISYRDGDGATVFMDLSTSYLFTSAMGPYLKPIGYWPSNVACRDDAITIRFTAGRVVVPQQLKSAALIILGQLYRYRETDVDMKTFATTFGFIELAHPFRVIA